MFVTESNGDVTQHFIVIGHEIGRYFHRAAPAHFLKRLLAARKDLEFDLGRLAETWRHGSVVRSWLLDLSAEILAEDEGLARVAPVVADSGEGRWTATELTRGPWNLEHQHAGPPIALVASRIARLAAAIAEA